MSKAIVLDVSQGSPLHLRKLVNTWIQERVELVLIVGPDAAKIKDDVDWKLVQSSDPNAFICTTSHENEPLEEVKQFTSIFGGVGAGEIVGKQRPPHGSPRML